MVKVKAKVPNYRCMYTSKIVKFIVEEIRGNINIYLPYYRININFEMKIFYYSTNSPFNSTHFIHRSCCVPKPFVKSEYFFLPSSGDTTQISERLMAGNPSIRHRDVPNPRGDSTSSLPLPKFKSYQFDKEPALRNTSTRLHLNKRCTAVRKITTHVYPRKWPVTYQDKSSFQ